MSSERGGKFVPVDKDIQLTSIDSVLAKLFRICLFELGANNVGRFNYLLENFLNHPANKTATNIKDRSSLRGTLRRELLKDKMSWRVFCKALNFLNVFEFEISIKLHHANKRVTEHKLHVHLNSEDLANDDEQ